MNRLRTFEIWLDATEPSTEDREQMAREYEAEQRAAAQLDALLPDDMKD